MFAPDTQFASDPLLQTATCARTRRACFAALAAGHRAVLLLADHATIATTLLASVAHDLAAAGRAVHHPPERLGAADLAHADPGIVVAIDRADTLARPALLAIDAHLRGASPTQLLLAGLPSFRALTGSPGLSTLHFAPLVVPMPGLPDAEAAAYLIARGVRPRPAVIRAAGGDPLALDRLSGRRLPVASIAEVQGIAGLLDRPFALLGGGIAVALAAAFALEPSLAWRQATPHAATFHAPLVGDAPSAGAGTVGVETTDPAGSDFGVTVDHEDPDLFAPHRVAARPGESLEATYRRVYQGLAAPPFAAVLAANSDPPARGALVFPAPATGWPSP